MTRRETSLLSSIRRSRCWCLIKQVKSDALKASFCFDFMNQNCCLRSFDSFDFVFFVFFFCFFFFFFFFFFCSDLIINVVYVLLF